MSLKRAWKAIAFMCALAAMYHRADDVHLPHSVGTAGIVACGLVLVLVRRRWMAASGDRGTAAPPARATNAARLVLPVTPAVRFPRAGESHEPTELPGFFSGS